MRKRLLSMVLVLALICILTPSAFANNTKLVALTFDDGPSWKFTPVLLDALKERDVRVTFFLVGYTLDVNMDIASRAFEEGHQLANHSYNHSWFSRLGADGIKNEVESTNELLREVTGQEDFMVRIPYGDITSTVKSAVDAPIMQWSVDPTNGNAGTSEDAMYRNLMKTVHDGAIILLHDTSQKNLNVALRAIDALLEEGYEFVTLDELFRLRGISPQSKTVYSKVPSGSQETYYDEKKLDEHWACGSIQAILDTGIMQGDEGGFKPDEYLSRAMAATILHRLAVYTDRAGAAEDIFAKSGFSDVPQKSWYYDAAAWAYEHSYIEGIGNGLFDPDSYITKEQFYTILARFAGSELDLAGAEWTAASYRDDARINEYARESVALFRNAGFQSLNDPELFRPGDNMTRAEAAELIHFLLEFFESGQESNRLPEEGGGSFYPYIIIGTAAALVPALIHLKRRHSPRSIFDL